MRDSLTALREKSHYLEHSDKSFLGLAHRSDVEGGDAAGISPSVTNVFLYALEIQKQREKRKLPQWIDSTERSLFVVLNVTRFPSTFFLSGSFAHPFQAVLHFPLIALVLASSVYPGVVVGRCVMASRAREPGQCTRCRYDLRGNESGRCPECGMAIPDEQKKVLRERGRSADETNSSAPSGREI
jgi:hypothetical protein